VRIQYSVVYGQKRLKRGNIFNNRKKGNGNNNF